MLFTHTGELKFDVFLSFANEDNDATETKIKIPLEEKGYAVCWHHKDFIAGLSILENMEVSIRSSRMIIVVLSDAFASSKFCLDELEFAKLKMKQTRKRCIVPVLLRNCTPLEDMKNFTYIAIEEKEFMKKLCRDLGNEYTYIT